jgi:NhaP-type Na+/H+ or K+/H+ antiporter
VETWSLAVVAALLLGYAVVSRRLEQTIVSAAMVFVVGGLVTGPEGLGWLDLQIGSTEVRVLAEATLTLVLFLDASRIDVRALRRELGFPVRLLGIGLPLTITAGTLVGALLFDQLVVAEALVLAIVLAPTDAALGQAVVTDRRLPSRVRQSLNVESGLNDGICVPLLFVALAVAEADVHAISTSEAVRIVSEEIGWGVAGGVAAGTIAALLVRLAARWRLADETWLQLVPIGSAALAYGLAAPLGGSGFIAAFVGGLVFGVLGRESEAEGDEPALVLDAAAELLSGTTFIVFGAVALGPALDDVGWRIIAYAVLSLTIVRMVPVAISLIGSGARRPTVAFTGWFGPRGLASIVFAVIVLEGSELPYVDVVVATVAVTVALSVFAHGMTALPLTDTYVRWLASSPLPSPTEETAVHEHPWRRPARRGTASGSEAPP